MRRGFSLAEVLVTCSLLALILGLLAELVSEYAAATNFGAAKDQATASLEFTIAQLRSDIEASVEILPPAGTQLKLRRVHFVPSSFIPPHATEVPAAPVPPIPLRFRPVTPPATWEPWPDTQLVEVTYKLEPSGLWRGVDSPSSSFPSGRSLLGAAVRGLQVESVSVQGLVSLRLSVEEAKGNVRSLNTYCCRMVDHP